MVRGMDGKHQKSKRLHIDAAAAHTYHPVGVIMRTAT